MRSWMPFRLRRVGRFLIAGTASVAVAAVGLVVVTKDSHAAGAFNYAEALQKSVWFYDAQRLGDLPATNRVSWRGDSFLSDGADVGLNLAGGFADAGDTIKATFPLAHTLTTLAWSYVDNPPGYTASGQSAALLSNLRWGMDYLIKAHPAPNRLVVEVGDPNEDHKIWAAAELLTYTRKTYLIDASCGGSEVAASTAAAFASSAMAFRATDPTYSATLLTHARQLYTFADTVRGNYVTCAPVMQPFYNSWSGYFDELVWGALWLYQATGETAFLDRARSLYPQLPRSGQSSSDPVKYAWTYDWDDKTVASVVMLAKITNDPQYIADANRWSDWIAGPGVNGSRATYSPGGQVHIGPWGSLRYSSSAAMLALYYADSGRFDATRTQRMHDFALRQIDYILGDNPSATSYMVGFGPRYIQMPHHRTAHGPWGNNPDQDPIDNRHILYGALIGGPTAADDTYGPERRSDFQKSEVAIDYNAGLTGALARLVKEYGGTALPSIPTETPDGPEMYVLASLNQSGTANGNSFFEIKALLQNKSAWPARPLVNGSFRYYFTLGAGQSPSAVQITSGYHQCAVPSTITQHSGTIYYVTIDCTGVRIAPTGQPDFTRENQFRITFPGAHDHTQDWSFAGVSTSSSTPTLANRIAVFDAATRVYGETPGTVTPTPPGAPGQPVASNTLTTSVTLAWPASAAGSNPIAGYDVLWVGGTGTPVATATTTSATVTGLTPATQYSFFVRARDTQGVQSANSPVVTVMTRASDPAPPGAPGQPTASNVGPSSVTLTWTAASPGTNPLAGYDVYRVGTPDVLVASSTTTTATVTGLTPATPYTFNVRARDNAGVTGPASASRTVTTANATPPSAPGTPTASGVTSSGVTLAWTASTPGSSPLASYEVHRVLGTTDTVAATVAAPTTTAAISGLTASTVYSFYVIAKDGDGVASPASGSVTVTTSATQTGACRVVYAVQNDWGSGFTTSVTITNTGTATVSGWTLRFAFPGNQQITQAWSASYIQQAANVTITNADWNGTLAPGASTQIGFNASYSGTNARPTSFTLNGAMCTTN